MAKGFSTVLDSQNDTSNDFDVHDLGHLGMFELDRGVPFRWSTPVATHRLALGVGDWALHFDTGAIRGAAAIRDLTNLPLTTVTWSFTTGP